MMISWMLVVFTSKTRASVRASPGIIYPARAARNAPRVISGPRLFRECVAGRPGQTACLRAAAGIQV